MKILITSLMVIWVSAVSVYATDYMTPEEIQRIWGHNNEPNAIVKTHPGHQPKDITDVLDDYAAAASFIRTLQYLNPDANFGGIIEAEHMPSTIETDNTSESVWIWCRYYQLTGDNQFYQNVLNSWQYMYRWPAWNEEGGSNPSSGYYRYYVGAWGLLAEMIYRDVYQSDTFRVYADSVADYMINHYLQLGTTNTMIYAWAMGCLYQYGVNTGVQEYIDYADSVSGSIKAWVDVSPATRLNRESWALSGGAIAWGLYHSYFAVHPDEAQTWFSANGQYLDTLVSAGSWNLAHNAWYALGHWAAFQATSDSGYFYNHAFLTDTLLAQDGDRDGGIPAEFDDSDNMDQSWCTAYLGFMCLNPLLTTETSVDEQAGIVPHEFAIVSNYPNPFNARTNIKFSGFPSGEINADIFDLMGRKVDALSGGKTDGSGLIGWNATRFVSGIYFIRVNVSGRYGVARAVLVK